MSLKIWGFGIKLIAIWQRGRLQVHALSKNLSDISIIDVGADFGKVGQFQGQIHISPPAVTHVESFNVIWNLLGFVLPSFIVMCKSSSCNFGREFRITKSFG